MEKLQLEFESHGANVRTKRKQFLMCFGTVTILLLQIIL